MATYRGEFRPSAQRSAPYVIAGVNVIAADSREEAQRQFQIARRARIRALLARGRSITDDEADELLASPGGQQIAQMMTYSAVGTGPEAADFVRSFADQAKADEVIVAFQSPTVETRLHSVELLADALALPAN